MTITADQLIERRRRALGPAYRHFYEKPLYLVRGEDVWLYDDQGRKYLDCYNNVPSVGHCHPEVVATLAKQASTLNTHTRYLHNAIVEYAEMLADTLPGNLSVCSLVCTGTEANDLAYRIARAVTGNEGAIVTAGAYHGNSTLVSELSHDCGAKRPVPDYIVDAEPPYTYRGPYGEDHPDYVDAYSGTGDNVVVSMFILGTRVAQVSCGQLVSNTATDTCFVGTINWTGGSAGNGTFTPAGTAALDF